jgi:hypothetical protein
MSAKYGEQSKYFDLQVRCVGGGVKLLKACEVAFVSGNRVYTYLQRRRDCGVYEDVTKRGAGNLVLECATRRDWQVDVERAPADCL